MLRILCFLLYICEHGYIFMKNKLCNSLTFCTFTNVDLYNDSNSLTILYIAFWSSATVFIFIKNEWKMMSFAGVPSFYILLDIGPICLLWILRISVSYGLLCQFAANKHNTIQCIITFVSCDTISVMGTNQIVI